MDVEIVESTDIRERYTLSSCAYLQAQWIENALEFLEWLGESIETENYPEAEELAARIEALQASAA